MSNWTSYPVHTTYDGVLVLVVLVLLERWWRKWRCLFNVVFAPLSMSSKKVRASPSASGVYTDEICPHKVSKESLVYWFNLLYWIVIEIYKSLSKWTLPLWPRQDWLDSFDQRKQKELVSRKYTIIFSWLLRLAMLFKEQIK